ncbi:MAG: SpoIID/LytB domain-containing protein [Candidatus Aminicenantes bacterium]|nr:SpoIID/LytB domain-containing protein [Candidatus Aminicenantes bacterium]
MKTLLIFFRKYFIFFLLCLFVLAGVPEEFAEDKSFFHGFVIPKPIIRIGLGVNLSDIKISSSSGLKVYEARESYKLIADNVDEVRIKGNKEKLNEKFLIQIVQSERKEEAETIAQELKTKIDGTVTVTQSTEAGAEDTFQVLVGDFRTRQEALSYIKKLNSIGIEDTWILRENITEEGSKPLWILVNDELKSLNKNTVLYLIPTHARSFLSFKGRNYRGIFILRSTRKGVVLINVLNLDDYLKGVVPSELSPYLFGELEAQKAQAIAARTYAFKKLRTNEDFDFDLDDTPNSQFYKGMNAEHPMSSLAVDQTRGQVALYKGKLIDALYTSTCGGMTADVEAIFNGPSLPYLRSTECVYENQPGYTLASEQSILPVYIYGKNISPQIVFLNSLGIIPLETDPVFYNLEVSLEEAKSWIGNTARIFGKTNPTSFEGETELNTLRLAGLMVDSFGWQERVDNLMFPSEKDFFLKSVNGGDGDKGDNVAYLIQTGVFPPSDGLQFPERYISRGELIDYLSRAVLSHEIPVEEGLFSRIEKDSVFIDAKTGEEQFVLSPDAFILTNNHGDYQFVSEVYLIGGERIKWVEKDGLAVYIEIIDLPQTNLLDRSSPYRSWQVRMSKMDIEKRINQYYPIGELVDLIPQKRSKSNRVVELLISGTESQAVVEGLRVRRVLGLREILFVIDRDYDESGSITHFEFNGRGWGHGVGLCQVGAYGMAQAGADFEEILKKYYRGITIGKIY